MEEIISGTFSDPRIYWGFALPDAKNCKIGSLLSALFQNLKKSSETKFFHADCSKFIYYIYSLWSSGFTLDALEHATTVICKTDSKKFYEVGVTIQRSKSSLTKIITFTPYYLIYNTTENPIELWELEALDIDNYLLVRPGEMLPFWPEYGATQILARIKGHFLLRR